MVALQGGEANPRQTSPSTSQYSRAEAHLSARQAQGKLATKLGDNAIIVKIPHFPEASKKFRFGRKTGAMPGENGDERTHGDHRKDHADE
jgi:hypothetical protein